MKAGAVDVLTKPFHDQEFLDAVRVAVARDDSARATYAQLQSIRQRLATLTRREREVLEHVVTGRLNKQIAADLGTVEKPSKCTARVMEKMRVSSLAELVRLTLQVGLEEDSRCCAYPLR